MDRLACVNVAALPLQLVLRRHPEWQAQPVAVLDTTSASGLGPSRRVLWVNEKARQDRVFPGMRYAAALSLCGTLRASELPECEIGETLTAVARLLLRFTPGVEPVPEDRGVFWLSADGLTARTGGALYESLRKWANLLRKTLKRDEQLDCSVVVGFSKFATTAVAKAKRGTIVFGTPEDETAVARCVPLECLAALEPNVCALLSKLDVKSVGDFVDLPREGLEKRFGKGAWRLYRLGQGELEAPLAAQPVDEPLCQRIHFEYSERDLTRLLRVIGRLLVKVLEILGAKSLGKGDRALSVLRLRLFFEGGGEHNEEIRPAAPTLDVAQILELVSLRLDSVRLPDAVEELELNAEGHRLTRKQLDIFEQKPRRDQRAANRALARIRAEFGDAVVVSARLREGHLPEAAFTWEPLKELGKCDDVSGAGVSDDAGDGNVGALVRRVYQHPVPLPARPRHEHDGWMLRGLEQGPVVRVQGPYIVSGGWWRRSVQREYHFAETQNGEILWVYYDRRRRRWFVQGRVE